MGARTKGGGGGEENDAALDRHFAAHPEDRGANVTIVKFYDVEGLVDDS